jgi:hypothetical protein
MSPIRLRDSIPSSQQPTDAQKRTPTQDAAPVASPVSEPTPTSEPAPAEPSVDSGERMAFAQEALRRGIEHVFAGGGLTILELQRKLNLDREGAVWLLETLEKFNIIGPARPGKKREVIAKPLTESEVAALKARRDAVVEFGSDDEIETFGKNLTAVEALALDAAELVEEPPVASAEPEPKPAPLDAPPRIVDIHPPLPEGFTEDQFTKIVEHIIGERGVVGDLNSDWLTDFLSEHYNLDRVGVDLMRRALVDRGIIESYLAGSTRKILVDRWPPVTAPADAPPGPPPGTVSPERAATLAAETEARAASSPSSTEPAPVDTTSAPTDTAPPIETQNRSPQFDEAVVYLLSGHRPTLSSLSDRFPDLTRFAVEDLIDELERGGIISKPYGNNRRKILVSKWPPEAAPADAPPEPPPAEPAPATTEPAPTTPTREPVPGEPDYVEHPDAGAPRPVVPVRRARPAAPEPAPASPPTPPSGPPPPGGGGEGGGEPPPEGPDTPPETSEPAATETAPGDSEPPAPKAHWYEASRKMVTDAAKRFLSSFRGEVQPQEEKDYKSTWGDVGKNAAVGLMSVAASYGGVKLAHDLPAWLYQKYITNPGERKLFQESFRAFKKAEEDVSEASIIEQKKAALETAINESKFLTKEKKKDLIKEMRDTIQKYATKEAALRTERNEKIAILLDEAIETRVKDAQVLKESLNTALMVSGIAVLRGAAYGSVAAYERYKKVANKIAKERAEGKHTESQFNEWIVKGFTETLYDLKGGGAETKIGKALNVVKGATVVLRAVGFAHLAMGEINVEGFSNAANPEVQFEKFINDLKEKGAGTLIDNALTAWERIPVVGSLIVDFLTEDSPAAVPEGFDAPVDTTIPAETVDPSSTEPFSDGSQELAPDQEVSKETIEKGLVKKGDGILRILHREGVDDKAALEAAREAGIVRAGGDTRLTTEAIGRLSVFTETKPDGDIEIKFFDTQTDRELSLEAARMEGFLYESGSAPADVPDDVADAGEPPATPEAPAEVPADAEASAEGVAPVETSYRDNTSVPNTLVDGSVTLETDPSGNFSSVNITGDTKDEIVYNYRLALEELTNAGHANSDEAEFLQKELDNLNSSNASPVEDTPDSGSTEPLKRFAYKGEAVRFMYDDKGEVQEAVLLKNNHPKLKEIMTALTRWDLEKDKVIDVLTDNRNSWSAASTVDDEYQKFTQDITALTKQEKLLEQMAIGGHENTPEYAQLKDQTDRLTQKITKLNNLVEKQFPKTSGDS